MKWLYLLTVPALLGGSYVAAQSYYGARMLPNLFVGGVAVGGLTLEETQKALETVAEKPRTVTVKIGRREYVLPSSDLGYTPDPQKAAQAAMDASQDASVFAHLSQGERKDVALTGEVDEALLRGKLRELAAEQEKLPVRASAAFVKTQYVVKPDQKGVRANVGGAVQAFLRDPQAEVLEVPLEATSAKVTAEMLAPRVKRANALIRPLKVIYPVAGGVKSTVLRPLTVADLFWLKDDLEPDALTITRELKEIAALFDKPAQNASYNFVGGKLSRVKEQTGTKLDLEKARPLLTAAVMNPASTQVKLPTMLDMPKLTLAELPDASKLSVISESTSMFAGSSAERSANVYAASVNLDGHVIAPDEVFSFNDAIGAISEANGFKKALVISGGRTVEGIGGGVCQVSTTAFRALYSAGLPVVERRQHAYRVRWYEPQVGFEAAVYQPGVDLKMKNDTGAPILIRAIPNMRRGSLTVTLYGVPDGRKVSVSPARILSRTPHPPAQTIYDPNLRSGVTKQVDWAVDGYHIQIYRSVKGGRGGNSNDVLETVYRPWRSVFAVGTG